MDGPIVDGNGRATGPIAFIDRDGVLNYGRNGYVNHPEELKIIPEAVQPLQDYDRKAMPFAL